MNATNEIALSVQYVRDAKFSLIPIPHGVKGPRAKGWQLEENAIRIAESAAQLTHSNIGIAHRWSGTCAVDIDDLQKAKEWFAKRGIDLDALLLAQNAVQIISGKPNRSKLLFRLPAGITWLPTLQFHEVGLELRCANRDGTSTVQDVLPPSIHPDTGKPYQWGGAGSWKNLPELPEAYLKLWLELAASQEKSTKAKIKEKQECTSPSTSLQQNPTRIYEGGRNLRLTSLGGSMRQKGMGRGAIQSALLAENLEKCDPPLPEAEVRNIASSVARYVPTASPQGPPASPFKLTPISELLQKPEPLQWLIYDYLLPESTAMLFGAPAVGKSLFCIAWAACVATGQTWYGHTVKRGPVVYLAGEGHHGIRRRFKAWAIHHDAEMELAQAPIVVSERGAAIDTEEGLAEVCAAIDAAVEKYGEPVLIIVDTLHRNMNGDENAAKDMSAYFHNTDYLRVRYKLTVLTVHHSGHSDSQRARGSTSIKGAVDTELLVEDRGGTRTLSGTKQKDGRLPTRAAFALEEVALTWIDASGIEEISVVLRPTNMPPPKGKVMPTSVRLAVDTFLAAARKHGRESEGRYLVSLDDWRSEFHATNTDDTVDAKKKAFQRARKGMQVGKALSVLDNDLWLTPDTAIWGDMLEYCAADSLVMTGDNGT